MSPEQVATAIELALYRVSDQMKGRDAFNIDVANGLREVATEIATILQPKSEAAQSAE